MTLVKAMSFGIECNCYAQGPFFPSPLSFGLIFLMVETPKRPKR